MNVYIVGYDPSVSHMFTKHGDVVVENINEADIVCFTGGFDISPSLYGEKSHPATYSDSYRDAYEVAFFEEANKLAIPMVGICRGGQLLNVLSGGKMWQHVNKHSLYGTHELLLLKTGETFQVTSTHHQMMRPAPYGEIVSSAPFKCDVATVGDSGYQDGVEIVYYDDTKCLCFQPHPEYNNCGDTYELFFRLINEYIVGE